MAELHVVDPFETESKDYSAFKFYTKSGDGGTPKNVQVTMPGSIVARMSELVNRDQYPGYRTLQDFIRDACYHRLRWLQENGEDPQLERLLDIWGHASRMEMRNDEMKGLAHSIERTKATLDAACNTEDWDMANFVLREAQDMANLMREPYKARMEEVVKEYQEKVDKGEKK